MHLPPEMSVMTIQQLFPKHAVRVIIVLAVSAIDVVLAVQVLAPHGRQSTERMTFGRDNHEWLFEER